MQKGTNILSRVFTLKYYWCNYNPSFGLSKSVKLLLIFCCISILSIAQNPKKEASVLLTNKHYSKAETMMISYVAKNKSDKEAVELLGDIYGHQKKWDKAIAQYKRLTTLNSKNANYYYKYGGSLSMKALKINKIRALGIIGDIKHAFLTAAKLDPKHIETRWALVELYMSLPGIVGGSKKTSLKYANELQALSKVDGYLAKGYIYEYDDEPKISEAYYRRAAKEGNSVNCSNTDKQQRNALHYQLGKVSADYNIQLDKGKKCLNVYIQNHTSADGVPLEWAYYRLAQIYKHKKNNEKALSYINKALKIRPDFKQVKKEKTNILNH